ncbi:ATP-binding cassette domain-containing protein [Paenibacillus sp. N1-5-1-14]|uniref:ABC-F family ATP-binding cassette domain-containing protein n=1 Tax=Paenibacillus radicibacter TaxID=2972488 RepID=UPI002159379A|nr:ABC-F family ATP-binding cassette domain-containing protein [Paenibacillus radicibacter]MCR8644721.1 ATP-binding cassette domain-containing protein [Paenibacillus radicibacter]
MSILTVTNLTHMFGDQLTFQDINFRLLKGEHAGLVGANGAGKSTLFRLLAGNLLPDQGKIEWASNVQVGFLEQHMKLQAGITVMQYLQRAFQDLYDKEQLMHQIADKMATAGDDLDTLLQKYGELQAILDHSDFYQIQAKIEDVVRGLGMMEMGLATDVSTLSGGQKTKLLLAKLLLEEPHVLLLDEPTNYLDTVHIDWLTGYLLKYPHAYLIVSHDEHFLNDILTVTFHLAHHTIRRYVGNYAQFKKEYALSQEQLQATYTKQNKEIAKLEAFIDINRIRKAKQAKSRQKALDKIVRVDKRMDTPQPRFKFNAQGNNAGAIVFEAKHLKVGYNKPLFKPLTLTVKRGDKIAIVGENGSGKSTLIKTLLNNLKPLSGILTTREYVKVAYYQQEDVGSSETPLNKVWALRPDLTQKDIRQTLAMSGLTSEHIRKPIHSLSGGEQAKVRLAELMLTESNLLVLDEPTNHLDVRAKQALRLALRDYKGTILLVSHEPSFYEDWVTDVWSVQDWR